jgi:hypothetical protein
MNNYSDINIENNNIGFVDRKYVPDNIKDKPLYLGWRRLIRELPIDTYDFHLTITFIHRQHDDVAIQSANFFLKLLNSYLTDQRYQYTGRCIEGIAFIERHGFRSKEREGAMHIHIMGYYSDAFHTKPSLDRLKEKCEKAVKRVTNHNGQKMMSVGTINAVEIYNDSKLINYLSKQLRDLKKLDNRILLVGKEGLIGWEPDSDHSLKHYQTDWWEKGWDHYYPVRKYLEN